VITQANHPHSWKEAFLVYTRPRVFAMLFLGFSAGLPFLLVFSTLSAWLTEADIDRATIGFFSWVGITYSIKVIWAPVIDRLPFPLLTKHFGKRRGWMLAGQTGIAIGLMGMAVTDPRADLVGIALLALLVAFSSATQDVALDAYRIEAVDKEYQGAMSAMYILGYRVALLVAGAGAFYIAEYTDWSITYLVMAACVSVGMVTVLLVQEPEHVVSEVTRQREQAVADRLAHLTHAPNGVQRLQAWFGYAVVSPFVDFFSRYGKYALLILLLVGVYRISDITMGVMANPFYLDLGFSKPDIANIAKFFGFFMTIFGAALGGVLVVRFGVFRPLVIGAILVAVTNLLFAHLATLGPDKLWLAIVISADNFSGGLATSAFIAYLSSLTSGNYTATQYALFSSFMTLPAKLLGGFSGIVVEAQGYVFFFSYAAALGIPAILLALFVTFSGKARERQRLAEAQAGRD
jgi:PAT family beta-lactamase induction signal transducer AmpG